LLSQKHMEKREETLAAFIMMVEDKGIINNIITMDEGAVSMHTPEIKRQAMQCLKKSMQVNVRLRIK
jgi:hypothetical protein